ncbi:MAG: DNA polymerase III subunit alpha [Bacteroidales bacterium]|nr:DNA polymerase III subunit alpha [Bacteroidales bacterium]
MSFTHLHVHTDYSVDGIAQSRRLFCEAERLGMPGLAITDHGTMAGVPDFLVSASRFPSVKPIIGCEFYLENEGRLYHLILLAKNLSGYHNLLKLCSSAHKVKNDDRPRITRENVAKFHEDLICTSACIGGEIPQAIIEGNFDKAKSITSWYKDLFGDDFYLEVALHKGGKRIKLSCIDNHEAYLQSNKGLVAKQRAAAEGIFRLSEELDIKVVVTNDVHFVNKEDAIVHDAFLCHTYNKRMENPKRIRYSHLEYLKSEKEMSSLFPNHPEVISNTQDILDKIEKYSINKDVSLPQLYENPKEVLSMMVNLGAEVRYGGIIPSDVKKRLAKELEVIDNTGNNDYFILIKYIVDTLSKGHGIIVGPGRSASTSSLVNYCLGITEVDPLRFGLPFERLLWPGRISIPQIDLDVEESRWEEALSILREKIGPECVAFAPTYKTLGNKKAWDIVSKAYDIPYKTRQRIKKIKSKFPCPLPQKAKLRRELDELYRNGSPTLKMALDQSSMLDAVHISRDIISFRPIISGDSLSAHLPIESIIEKNEGKNTPVSQYDLKWAEDCGVTSLYFIPLRILDVIKQTLDIINCRYPFDVDIKSIPLNDDKTMEVFVTGDTSDIFMFQSENLRKLLKEFRPDTFSDLVLLNTLYRAVSLNLLPDCLARKRGEGKASFEIPELEAILRESYGVPAYQEQLIEIAKSVGLSDVDAVLFWKHTALKKKEYMDVRGKFIEGGINKGHSKEAMESLYERLMNVGCWTFSKSHSVSYTLIAWRCAWLKAHFPVEYVQTYNNVFPD